MSLTLDRDRGRFASMQRISFTIFVGLSAPGRRSYRTGLLDSALHTQGKLIAQL